MDDLIYETDGSSENRDDDKLNSIALNYTEILKVNLFSFFLFFFLFILPLIMFILPLFLFLILIN